MLAPTRIEHRPPAPSIGVAFGAVALGAIAVGALAIGYLAIRRLDLTRAHIRRLEVDNLLIRRLYSQNRGPRPANSDSDPWERHEEALG